MKTYWDYKEQERSALTEEQVKALLNVELMEKGVIRPQPPVLKEIVTPESLGGKRKFYGVKAKGKYGAEEDLGVVFKDIASAEALVALNPMKSDYDYEAGSDNRYALPLRDASIAVQELYAYETIQACKSDLKQNKAAAEANSKSQQEYDAAMVKVNKVTDGVWADWFMVRNIRATMERVVATYKEYCTLTNDSYLALTFLEKAHTRDLVDSAREWFPGEIPEHGRPMAVEAMPAPVEQPSDF